MIFAISKAILIFLAAFCGIGFALKHEGGKKK